MGPLLSLSCALYIVWTDSFYSIISFQQYAYKSTSEIIDVINFIESMYARCQLFGILLKREGLNFKVNNYTVEKHLQSLYHQAGCLRHWAVVRYTSSLLSHNVDSISPFITAVLVHGKQVSRFSTSLKIVSDIYKYMWNRDISQVDIYMRNCNIWKIEIYGKWQRNTGHFFLAGNTIAISETEKLIISHISLYLSYLPTPIYLCLSHTSISYILRSLIYLYISISCRSLISISPTFLFLIYLDLSCIWISCITPPSTFVSVIYFRVSFVSVSLIPSFPINLFLMYNNFSYIAIFHNCFSLINI